MSRREPGSPVAVTVVFCDGHRCRSVRDRTDTGAGEGATLLGALRERVRRSRHGLLIRADCLGVCARSPAVWLVRRTGPDMAGGVGELFGPLESPEEVRTLLDAIPANADPSSRLGQRLIDRNGHRRGPGGRRGHGGW